MEWILDILFLKYQSTSKNSSFNWNYHKLQLKDILFVFWQTINDHIWMKFYFILNIIL